MLKRLIIASFIVLSLVITLSCSNKKILTWVSYTGTVKDSTGNNIQDAKVNLLACVRTAKNICDQYVVGSDMTDASGKFRIREKAAVSDRYFVFVTFQNKTLHFGEISRKDLKQSKFENLTLK